MKKIGILTFQNTTNYGAIFQEYALQKFINDNFCNAEVINYTNKTLKKRYSLNPFICTSIYELIKKSIFLTNDIILKMKFQKFVKKNINVSKEKYSEKTIKKCDSIYSTFIAGSDQIWNLCLSGNDKNYFMTFANDSIKRNSYAASNGTGKICGDVKAFLDLMKLQNHISVREKTTAEDLLTNNMKCSVNIDPVFLSSKENWISISKKKVVSDKEYIFVYEVSRTPKLRDYAKELANKFDLEIVFISTSSKNIKGAKKLNCIGPDEFIYILNNARFIITSSFHGFAMSIIMNKNVFYDIPSINQKESFGSRLDNLADIFDLKYRNISSGEFKFNKKINFDIINEKINELKANSYCYIKNIVEDVINEK